MSCPICNNKDTQLRSLRNLDAFIVECPCCGDFEITRIAKVLLERNNWYEKEILSYITRYHFEFGTPLKLNSDNIDTLTSDYPISTDFFSIINQIVLFTSKKQEKPAGKAKIKLTDHPAIFQSSDGDMLHLFNEAIKLGYIEQQGHLIYSLTPDGWKLLQELKEKQIKSNQAFVAMSFSKDKKEIWQQGIKPILESLGYNAIRIDEKEHNDMIIDHIIAEINKSGLVIADFTEHKHGVYFEAGYAMGLGIPVIWTCHEDDISGIHFDTKPFNHIGWTTPEELGKKLKIRIEATIPNRPSPRSEDSSLLSE